MLEHGLVTGNSYNYGIMQITHAGHIVLNVFSGSFLKIWNHKCKLPYFAVGKPDAVRTGILKFSIFTVNQSFTCSGRLRITFCDGTFRKNNFFTLVNNFISPSHQNSICPRYLSTQTCIKFSLGSLLMYNQSIHPPHPTINSLFIF